jgi:hypothetical protein
MFDRQGEITPPHVMVAGGDGAFDDRPAPARHPERTETELWNRASICLEGFHHRLPKSAAVADQQF